MGNTNQKVSAFRFVSASFFSIALPNFIKSFFSEIKYTITSGVILSCPALIYCVWIAIAKSANVSLMQLIVTILLTSIISYYISLLFSSIPALDGVFGIILQFVLQQFVTLSIFSGVRNLDEVIYFTHYYIHLLVAFIIYFAIVAVYEVANFYRIIIQMANEDIDEEAATNEYAYRRAGTNYTGNRAENHTSNHADDHTDNQTDTTPKSRRSLFRAKFENLGTEEEIKKAYREYAKLYHPDDGGDSETMADLNAAKDEALKRVRR